MSLTKDAVEVVVTKIDTLLNHFQFALFFGFHNCGIRYINYFLWSETFRMTLEKLIDLDIFNVFLSWVENGDKLYNSVSYIQLI